MMFLLKWPKNCLKTTITLIIMSLATLIEMIYPYTALRVRLISMAYGHLDWFDKFYLDKDIILSPNIPFKLCQGSFDGFPLAACTEAGLRKVAIFCTDELHLNQNFINNQELVIVEHNADKIAQAIESCIKAPEKLRQIGEKGALKIRKIYGYEAANSTPHKNIGR